MPSTCAVASCRSRSGDGVDNIKFFHVLASSPNPKLKELLEQRTYKWLKAINRLDVEKCSIKNLRTCSKHFISGKPANIHNVDDVDWIPTQNLGVQVDDSYLAPSTRFSSSDLSTTKQNPQQQQPVKSSSISLSFEQPSVIVLPPTNEKKPLNMVERLNDIDRSLAQNLGVKVGNRYLPSSSKKFHFSVLSTKTQNPEQQQPVKSSSIGLSFQQASVMANAQIVQRPSNQIVNQIEQTSDIDWTPNQNLGVQLADCDFLPSPSKKLRFSELSITTQNPEQQQSVKSSSIGLSFQQASVIGLSPTNEQIVEITSNQIGNMAEHHVKKFADKECQTEEFSAGDKECQTELSLPNFDLFEINGQYLQYENSKLRELIQSNKIRLESFENDDDKACFFTGISTFLKMRSIYNKLKPDLPRCKTLSTFEIFYIVLVRMRLDLSFKFLSYQFNVSRETVSTYWHKGIAVMHAKLRSVVYFPEREAIKHTMPAAFQMAFGEKVSIILDCFEVFIEKSSNIITANQTWSSYKHAHTAKYLIGSSPQGAIIYISDAYGGRASDKFIVQDSGFLGYIKDGDVVMADRGFLIENDLKERGASLAIPAFTKGKKQLHPLDVENTRQIANVRILVERVIGQIRLKYTIFKNRQFPAHFLCESSNYSDVSVIDQMIVVACAMVNFCEPIYSKQMASVFET